jgi:hypothetical protein
MKKIDWSPWGDPVRGDPLQNGFSLVQGVKILLSSVRVTPLKI